MNKKLVAVAVAGLLAAPLAQAQTANVTLYGRLNISTEVVNGKQTNGTNPNIYRVSSNSSRFGIRGSEGIGNGLNIIFQIESSVSGDAGGGTIAGRDSFIGAQGNFGTFRVGRFHAPYDDIHGIFGDTTTALTSLLGTASTWANGVGNQNVGGGGSQVDGSFDDRYANSVRYDSPKFAGFTGHLQYAALENNAPGRTNGGAFQAATFYNNGPVQAGLAYARHMKVRGADLNDQALSLAGNYNFGMFNIGAVYERLKYEIAGTATIAAGDLKRDFYAVGSNINIGPGVLYVYYGDAAKGKGSAGNGARVGGLVKGDQTDSQQYEVSYMYPVSKRTSVYTGYTKINNSKNAWYAFNTGAYAVAQGAKPAGFIIGAIHNF
jgi:predicted porin